MVLVIRFIFILHVQKCTGKNLCFKDHLYVSELIILIFNDKNKIDNSSQK
jgi:hypothetical protein